ncbi:hypothetical protein WJU16_24645 [Chitinophaga pollutisoli]|uniref:DUF3826 domain-containing protein n=1 Tax=Chitinophaga pollutisoli TaxID=3133966 RepID=A0ABZ2YQG6_9BACT
MFKISIAVLATGLLAFSANSIITRLGISDEDAHKTIDRNLLSGKMELIAAYKAKQIPAGERAQAVKEMGDYIKAYVSTPEYKAAYVEEWEKEAPKDANAKLRAAIKKSEKDYQELEKIHETAEAEYKASYAEALKTMKDLINALKDPKHKMHKIYVQSMVGEVPGPPTAAFKAELAKYEEKYPGTVEGMLKLRLKSFLALSADIDFNAALVKKGNKMIFEDPALEKRSAEWKQCFRAGPEAVKAARAYAEQWLKELP